MHTFYATYCCHCPSPDVNGYDIYTVTLWLKYRFADYTVLKPNMAYFAEGLLNATQPTKVTIKLLFNLWIHGVIIIIVTVIIIIIIIIIIIQFMYRHMKCLRGAVHCEIWYCFKVL